MTTMEMIKERQGWNKEQIEAHRARVIARLNSMLPKSHTESQRETIYISIGFATTCDDKTIITMHD